MKKILLVLIVFTSCAPVYVPNIRNSPMFTKGQEFQFSGQLGNGLDGQVAYSITNHFGILANYNYIIRTSNFNGRLQRIYFRVNDACC